MKKAEINIRYWEILVANDVWTSLNALTFDSARAGHMKSI